MCTRQLCAMFVLSLSYSFCLQIICFIISPVQFVLLGAPFNWSSFQPPFVDHGILNKEEENRLALVVLVLDIGGPALTYKNCK
jgi:hypothetical protein